MTEFRGIKVVAVPATLRTGCNGCIADSDPDELVLCTLCGTADEDGPQSTFQPASLHDGRPHVVLTGGRKPSFPIKAVWFRDGRRFDALAQEWRWDRWGVEPDGYDIIAVERAKEGV